MVLFSNFTLDKVKPTAIQVVGTHMNDERLLVVASEIDRVLNK